MLRKTFCVLFLLMVAVVVLPPGVRAQTATESVLYSFCSLGGSTCADGSYPDSSLIQAADGNFYGTTNGGGSTGNGTIFKLTPTGLLTTIHNFCTVTGCADGSVPVGLIQGGDGNLYGTTTRGGVNLSPCNGEGCGTVFKMSLAGVFETLYSFCNEYVDGDCTDGRYPSFPPIEGADGNYYGTTPTTLFQLTPAGSLTTLQNNLFSGDLLQGADGNFYGVTQEGGNYTNCPNTGCGTVYSFDPSVAFTTLYDFDEGYAYTTFAQGSDGSLYGTFPASSGAGYLFKITSSGSFTSLYGFCSQTQCADGEGPNPLWPGSDGNFYGTTSEGGLENAACAVGCGTFFEITPTAAFADKYSFCSQAGSTCEDSFDSFASVVQGSDGSFYGVGGGGVNILCPTRSDGETGCGTVFKVSASPALPAPVQLTLSQSSIALGDSVTLSWQVLNAFSKTMQQCFAFLPVDSSGAGAWTGLQAGSLESDSYQGSSTIKPTAAGVYTYALTCGGVESGSVILRVGNGKAVTSTTLHVTSPVTLGSVATLIAATGAQQNIGAMAGAVKFSAGNLSLGTVNLTNGSANLNVTAQGIPTGTYNITATYSGDSNYQPSSGTAAVTVLGYGTAITLSASPTQLTQGQATTLSATVARSSVSGTPSGNVTFSYGSTVLGTAKLGGGVAKFTAATNGSIPPGTYAVTAKYDGDSTDQSSVSSPVSVTVIAATETSLSVSPNPVPKDSAVTLMSVVKRAYNAGVPTGTVTFSVGSYVVGKETLDGSGSAVLNASDVGIAAGTYRVTASYSGDAQNAASISTGVNLVVQ